MAGCPALVESRLYLLLLAFRVGLNWGRLCGENAACTFFHLEPLDAKVIRTVECYCYAEALTFLLLSAIYRVGTLYTFLVLSGI